MPRYPFSLQLAAKARIDRIIKSNKKHIIHENKESSDEETLKKISKIEKENEEVFTSRIENRTDKSEKKIEENNNFHDRSQIEETKPKEFGTIRSDADSFSDFSAGSSDEYIPNSETDTTSACSDLPKSTRTNRKNYKKTPVTLSQSSEEEDSDYFFPIQDPAQRDLNYPPAQDPALPDIACQPAQDPVQPDIACPLAQDPAQPNIACAPAQDPAQPNIACAPAQDPAQPKDPAQPNIACQLAQDPAQPNIASAPAQDPVQPNIACQPVHDPAQPDIAYQLAQDPTQSNHDDPQDERSAEPGCSNSNRRRKTRKSLKERRADRISRILLRNSGKSYITIKGKIRPDRLFEPLTGCKMKCSERVPESVREYLFNQYWNLGSYDERAQFMEKLITLNKKKSAKVGSTRKREYSNSYKLIHFHDEYKVCKGCFLKTFGESNRYVQTICEKLQKYGRVPKTLKGRAASYKKISDERLKEVERHILKFPAYESHYSRSRTTKKYLSSDLSVETMYSLYSIETDNPVSKTVYNSVFKSLNLSFKKPSVDTCNKCNSLQNKIKYLTDPEQISEVQHQLNKHQEEYKLAYNEKRQDKAKALTNDETCVIAFDLQQCLPTPLLNTQSAFYKRQLWVYNLTIHDFKTNYAYCYMWPESSGGRGANQIASCLYEFIVSRLPLLHPTCKHLIMYSDSCSGQNKNSIVTTALLIATKDSEMLLTIEHKFLVPGHTHMEVDSDHALIEKAKKKTSMNIHHPRDWSQLVRSASNRQNKFSVIEFNERDFYDFAKFTKHNLLIKKFNISGQKFVWSDVRSMKYNKGQFGVFEYKESLKDNDYLTMSYLKRNKNYDLISINTIEKCYNGSVPISEQKKKDLLSLLEYIDPSVHAFYHNLVTNKDLRDTLPDIISEEDE